MKTSQSLSTLVLVLVALAFAMAPAAARASGGGGMTKTAVCHKRGDGEYVLITIADAALPAHLAHGDGRIGDPVSGMEEGYIWEGHYVFDAQCVPVESSPIEGGREITEDEAAVCIQQIADRCSAIGDPIPPTIAMPAGVVCPCWAPAELWNVTAENQWSHEPISGSCSSGSGAVPPDGAVIQNYLGSTPGAEGGFAAFRSSPSRGSALCLTRDFPQEVPAGGPNETDFGDPYLIQFTPYPDTALWVVFGLVADTHADASTAAWPYTDNMNKNRDVISDLKGNCVHMGCHGIVILGDLVDDNNVQNLVAFRQLWEHDYPGHDGGAIKDAADTAYDAYSKGVRINKPVFATLGNHDTPPFGDDPMDWNYSAEYIRARYRLAPQILSYHGYGAYAWRWGQYYFIALGEWAGSVSGGTTSQSQAKLDWLRSFLTNHVGDSNAGVVIFQHYGWDDFSTESRWWTSTQREQELMILTRRENATDPARPYNILGIFSGHRHSRAHISVLAGHDASGNEIRFDNYVADDAHGNGRYGSWIVRLEHGLYLRILDGADLSTYSLKPIQVGN